MIKNNLIVLACLFSSTLSAMIDDGILAQRSEFPSVVKVTRFQHRGMVFGAASDCTGTLIAPSIVLTAAHCLGEPGSISRVSIAGDEKGLTSHTPISGRGIRVKALHMPSRYPKLSQLLSAMRTLMNTKEFKAKPREEQIAFFRSYLSGSIQMAGSDMAFIELESAQPIPTDKISQLACDVLEKGEGVTIAGFGKNVPTGETQNRNTDGVLHSGSNQIGENQNVYFLPRQAGLQNANQGDSGGPLFKKDLQDKVYGVVSSGHKVGDLDGVLYASTGSDFARLFYKELLETPTASARLKAIVRGCLPAE